MNAREYLMNQLQVTHTVRQANARVDAHRADILREVADLLEQGLVKEPCGEAEEHLNNCYQNDIRRLRRMAKEATS